MARLIFEGLTLEEAKVLASWYDGQGEQDADIWFECRADDGENVKHRAPKVESISQSGEDIIVKVK